MVQTIITSGKAVLINGGLRCNNLREADPTKKCGRQLVRANSAGQIAGDFLCPRCGNHIEVTVARP
jgi:hypothetical protein